MSIKRVAAASLLVLATAGCYVPLSEANVFEAIQLCESQGGKAEIRYPGKYQSGSPSEVVCRSATGTVAYRPEYFQGRKVFINQSKKNQDRDECSLTGGKFLDNGGMNYMCASARIPSRPEGVFYGQ